MEYEKHSEMLSDQELDIVKKVLNGSLPSKFNP